MILKVERVMKRRSNKTSKVVSRCSDSDEEEEVQCFVFRQVFQQQPRLYSSETKKKKKKVHNQNIRREEIVKVNKLFRVEF